MIRVPEYIDLVLTEKIGEGRFCPVKRAIGTYVEGGDVVPYAIKIYNRRKLKSMRTTNNQGRMTD